MADAPHGETTRSQSPLSPGMGSNAWRTFNREVRPPRPGIREQWRRDIHPLINGPDPPPGIFMCHSGGDKVDVLARTLPIEEAPPAPPKAVLPEDNATGGS